MITNALIAAMCYVAAHEGFRASPYPDPGDHSLRIGYGAAAQSATQTCTRVQASAWLQRDLQAAYLRLRVLIPRVGLLSPELQIVLVSETYRGMLAKSPKTLVLLNARQFEAAGREYRRNKDIARRRLNEAAEQMEKEESWKPNCPTTSRASSLEAGSAPTEPATRNASPARCTPVGFEGYN